MNDTIIQGKIARAGYTGLTAARMGVKTVRFMASKPFSSPKRRVAAREKLDSDNATILFKAFSQLRGTALKVAQMLSMETDLLPETYRRELAKAQHQVPPLNRAVARKMISSQLGSPPEKIFAHFDTRAFAAASLGQVHAATSLEGEELAVKIQYPGIGDTIDNDIRMIRRLIRAMPKSHIMLDGLKEIRLRLREETDYRLEAGNLRWFEENLRIEGIMIPKVYKALTTKTVLTMQRLPGVHLQDWLKTKPSVDERNHFGDLIGRAFQRSFYDLKKLHADPNPGNYLFAPDGTLGLVDFGCVKRFSADFVEKFSALLDAHLRNSREDVLAAYRKLDLLEDISSPTAISLYDEVLKPMGDWLLKSMLPDTFDFAANPGYASEGIHFFEKMMHHPEFQNTNTEFIFLDRTIFGLYCLYEQMGAAVPFIIPGKRGE